jgi:hypothetical protein
MNNNYKTTVPVALVFFSRPDVLKLTFEAIREAKPSTLFLIQDGSRSGNLNDEIKIQECREIVKNIDWDCKVFRNYSEENMGCGMRVFSGISWAFQHVDRLAIIEDDCVPSLDFFKFCEELLEKYKDDERIDMISGMNNLGFFDKTPYDYFFTLYGTIWGWATWKRVWDTIDYKMNWLNDTDATRLIENLHGKDRIKIGREKYRLLNSNEKLTSWSYQRGINALLNSRLAIVPKFNLITNVGLTENGANSLNSIKFTPKGLRSVYYMKTYEINFPLKHPKYIINDIEYKRKLDRLMGNGHPWVRFFRTIESITYRIIYGDFKSIFKGLKRRIQQ